MKCDNLKDVYYTGSVPEWNELKGRIQSGNEPLLNARLHIGPVVPLVTPTTIQIEDPAIPVSTTVWAVSQSSDGRPVSVSSSEVDADRQAVFGKPLTPGSKIFFLEPGTFRPLAPAAILGTP